MCIRDSSISIKREINSYLGYFDLLFTFRLRSRFRLILDLGYLNHKSGLANTTTIAGGRGPVRHCHVLNLFFLRTTKRVKSVTLQSDGAYDVSSLSEKTGRTNQYQM